MTLVADGIILMTAIVPTTGHERLVRFARDFLAVNGAGESSRLFLLISTRSGEPTDFRFRAEALRGEPGPVTVVPVHHDDDAAPQSPSGPEDDEFWAYWRDVCASATGGRRVGFVFASEAYGEDVARVMGAEFVPVDIPREVDQARGSEVRADLFRRWREVAPAARPPLTTTWVLFGQESVGKTTLSRLLADRMGGAFYHEWARPYLEAKGSPPVNNEVMSVIVRGQAALEAGAARDDRLLRFLDTDLLSTLGYYRLWGGKPDPLIFDALDASARDLRPRYLLLSDRGVPFEPDPLRYGGDRRESDMGFWEDLLKERGAPYSVLDAATLEDRYEQAREVIMSSEPSIGLRSYDEISGFVRDR